MDTLTSTLQVNVTLFPVNKEPMTLTETIGAGSVCTELKLHLCKNEYTIVFTEAPWQQLCYIIILDLHAGPANVKVRLKSNKMFVFKHC